MSKSRLVCKKCGRLRKGVLGLCIRCAEVLFKDLGASEFYRVYGVHER